MVCGGFYCYKNALAALNILYILVAIILMSLAGYGYWIAVITNIGVLGGLVACGVFLFLVALLGLFGALKHHQVLLFFYMIILFLVFVLQFTLACVCLTMNEDQVYGLVEESWINSGMDTKAMVQHQLDCCGLKRDPADEYPSCSQLSQCVEYANRTDPAVPACCLTQSLSYNDTTVPPEHTTPCPQQTCWYVIHTNVNRILKTAGAVGLFFSVTEVFGVWLTVRYRNLKDPRAFPSAFL